ncbi:DUF2125 domain-containing protein [Sulfitobacter sp. M57]|uniref:DUF2125 domain-containing protein n=1 Tax=unclassified Sulfitobacter TaxID=196795 RepID=UPI0023E2A0FF|nr:MULTISPECIES: DUF2125 domain-containing protein [unclassified Sulfitobacter]MDF3415326.1 DUF2125 domain-containing protein [Sulfitobacter sp. KE5]MDF3422807.1 DUF2125 domain-containing protein [Sulfitobacter sp. KE43]MDF3433872.1 DUF2125 domain-containing protein [Sulfitobacter sp. KE42]MDF3459512.1 DUF2125 domain-containing protein [Sulfitobacter sp. S74]MDF3463411.1 DUF2125 domain-containing protein [Sulfitobacter sp. Ks18]
MSRFTPLAVGLALPFSLATQAAWADLTPQDVWGDWRNYLEGMGYEITATETVSGDDLTVSDLRFSFSMPETDGVMSLSLETLGFVQNRDGSVAIVMPDDMPMTMTGTDEAGSGEPFTLTLNFSQTGHAITASGDPDAMTYLYTAEQFAMDMTQMQVGDKEMSGTDARINVTGTNLNSTTTMTVGEMRSYDQSGSISAVAFDVFVNDPEGENAQGAIKGAMNGLTFTGQGEMPREMAKDADMATLLSSGFDMAGTLGYASGSSEFDIKDPENGNYVMTTTSQGGDFGFKMGPDGLLYDVAQRDLNVNVTAEMMPLPFEIKMAESGFKLAMPVSKSDEEQDFSFGLKMADFTMSDFIWSMFDPSAQLPRDPATVVLDLTGKAKLLVDWMNPEATAALTGAPGEVKQVSLGTLLVDAAGAKLEGAGDVTFDGAAGGLVPGAGNPVGDVNLALSGGNALLDKLVAIGLLPQDQAMGARMMMGLFAVPGDAPDTLKSKIEFTPDGQVLANGQRLR